MRLYMCLSLLAAAVAHGPTHGWPCDDALCAKPAPPSGVVNTRLDYAFEGLEYQGYVASPSASHHKLPIALVVHGMDGEGEIEQFRADQLAHLGFIAFAVDLFGKGKRTHGDFMKGQEYVGLSYADTARLHRQLAAQVDALAAAFPIADAANFVVAGYCYGGNIALEYARGAFPGLRAAVSFHGTFASAPASPSVPPLSAAVQLHHADDDFQDMDMGDSGGSWGGADSGGGDDAGSWGRRRLQSWGGGGAMARKAVSALTEVENELRDAGAERWMTIRYGKVGHAWTYPTSDEYKEFEAINAHDASFALYRQLGLLGAEGGLAGTPCAAEGVACGDGLTCKCARGRRRRRLLFASAPGCVCSA